MGSINWADTFRSIFWKKHRAVAFSINCLDLPDMIQMSDVEYRQSSRGLLMTRSSHGAHRPNKNAAFKAQRFLHACRRFTMNVRSKTVNVSGPYGYLDSPVNIRLSLLVHPVKNIKYTFFRLFQAFFIACRIFLKPEMRACTTARTGANHYRYQGLQPLS